MNPSTVCRVGGRKCKYIGILGGKWNLLIIATEIFLHQSIFFERELTSVCPFKERNFEPALGMKCEGLGSWVDEMRILCRGFFSLSCHPCDSLSNCVRGVSVLLGIVYNELTFLGLFFWV